MAADNQRQDTSQYTSIYSLAIPPGIKRDGTVFQSDQYTDGVWCRFQRGEPRKIGGYRSIFTSQVGIYRGMISQPYNGVNYIFAGAYEELDVFTTGTNYAIGSGPYKVNILPGTTFATVLSNTTTDIVIEGDVTTVFPPGSKVIFDQTADPIVEYTVSTATYSSPNTTLVLTTAMPAGTVTTIWLNDDPVFEADPSGGPFRNLWQFDAQFSPQGGDLAVFAHPGKNLENIDNGVVSQVLVGPITPDANNEWNFTGLADTGGQNPTYQPISVDGGVCVLYPFIFVYGSNGYIANNNVSNTAADYNDRSFYDWNGPLANQTNVSSSKIVKGMPMRGGTNAPAGLFWATDSLIRVTFTPATAPLYWNYDIVSSQISIMSSSAVVEMDGVFFWMGVDRFYVYNGQVTVLENDKNVNYLFDNINYAQRQKVWATKVPRYNEIWFFYPRGSATECTDAIIYNVKDKLWYDAGQAVGAQRSCGYTTELFPTPIWADWNYNPVYSPAFTVIAVPPGQPAISNNQFYIDGNVTPVFSPGSYLTFAKSTNYDTTYRISSAEFYFNSTIGGNGATLITLLGYSGTSPAVGQFVYKIGGGFNIWQHEFGVNKVTQNDEDAIYSSITTSDISWLTGTPSQNSLQGVNRRTHLRRVEPNFLQAGTMSMTVIGRKFAGGQYEELNGPYYFNQDTGKIDLRVEHRLMRLKFESNEINGDYQMGRNLITCEFGDERP